MGTILMVGNWMTRAPFSAKSAALSLACSRALVTTTVRPKSGFFSNQSSLSLRRTTSPTTMMEGLVKPSRTAASGRSASVEARERCLLVVPQYTRAAGVPPSMPDSMSLAAISGRFFMPMRKTSVEALRARAFQLCTEPGLVGSSWPVMMVTEEDHARCVSGMPA